MYVYIYLITGKLIENKIIKGKWSHKSAQQAKTCRMAAECLVDGGRSLVGKLLRHLCSLRFIPICTDPDASESHKKLSVFGDDFFVILWIKEITTRTHTRYPVERCRWPEKELVVCNKEIRQPWGGVIY